MHVASAVLSLFSRCASVHIPPSACISVQLFFAAHSPQILSPVHNSHVLSLGVLCDSCLVGLADQHSKMRLMLLSSPCSSVSSLHPKLFAFGPKHSKTQFTVHYKASPLADTQKAIQFSALRLGIHRARMAFYSFKEYSSIFSRECLIVNPLSVALPDLCAIAFDSRATAASWSHLAASLSRTTLLKQPLDARFRQSAETMAKMHSLLANALSKGVQRTLSATTLGCDLPLLLEPSFSVYALVSPLWSKVYVGATGFKRPRAIMERWWEHIKKSAEWKSSSSKRRYQHHTPPLYRAMAAIDPSNVIVIPLARAYHHNLGSVERHFIRLLAPTFNAVGTASYSRFQFRAIRWRHGGRMTWTQ